MYKTGDGTYIRGIVPGWSVGMLWWVQQIGREDAECSVTTDTSYSGGVKKEKRW